MKNKKSPMLPLTTRKRIADFAEKNENATFSEIAEHFNCSYAQARKAAIDGKEGKFNRTATKTRKKKFDIDVDIEEALEKLINDILSGLETEELDTSKKVAMATSLINAHKQLTSLKLEVKLKSRDAKIVAGIIKYYEPDATPDRIMEVYNEVIAILKAEK